MRINLRVETSYSLPLKRKGLICVDHAYRIACAVGFSAWEMYLCPLFLKSSDTQRKTLDPGLRRDDVLSADGLKFVIPAYGVAGISCSMLHARKTALACKPVRALQGGIQRLYFAKLNLLN